MPTLDGSDLGLLPTMGVGSYASPSWLIATRRALRAGTAGPADVEEAVQDAVKMAVWDQEEAGLDILTDGEIRRQRFLWNVVEKLSGLNMRRAERKLGIMSYDSAPRFETTERVGAPDGFGLIDEFTFVRDQTDKPLKVCCPGPLTIAMPITLKDGYPQGDYMPLLYDLAELVNRELPGGRGCRCDVYSARRTFCRGTGTRAYLLKKRLSCSTRRWKVWRLKRRCTCALAIIRAGRQ